MKVLVSHPTSNQFNRTALSALLEREMLGEFHTSVASFPGEALDQLGELAPFSQLKRRRFNPGLRPYTKSAPFFELGRIFSGKAGIERLITHEKGIFCLDAVYRNLDAKVASVLGKVAAAGTDSIYAYEDGAYLSFLKAQELGMACFYDQPIGYWRAARRLLSQEREKWPQWAATMTGLGDSDEKLKRKDRELEMADVVFAASSFTARTLEDFPGTLPPVKIVPYGFPQVSSGTPEKTNSNRKRLKLLFVGGLSQRKGIADLFTVADRLSTHIELTLVGQKAVVNCSALNDALTRHRWIPSLSHQKILRLMQEQDVLVFPSLFEGFGLVITEAMSQGTPVITTDRTAGPDLITHDENGWLISAGSTDLLQNAIENLLIRPELVKQAGRAAINSAKQRPWEVYGKELVQAMEQYCKENHETIYRV